MIRRDSDDEVSGVRPDFRRLDGPRIILVPARGYGEIKVRAPIPEAPLACGCITDIAVDLCHPDRLCGCPCHLALAKGNPVRTRRAQC